MIEKIEKADINYETIRNIVFIPGKAEISALPSKGLTNSFDHCDGCHLRARPLTLLALGFFGWCSTGGGGGVKNTPLHNSFAFKVRLLKFCTELLWDKMNILG